MLDAPKILFLGHDWGGGAVMNLGQTTRGGHKKIHPCSWGVKKLMEIDI